MPLLRLLMLSSLLSASALPSAGGHLTSARRSGMVATIQVGTPPQELRVLLDSASADLWVPAAGQRGRRGFKAEASSSYKAQLQHHWLGESTHKAMKLQQGGRDISGYAGEDTVRLGSLTIEGQSLLTVRDSALPRQEEGYDGVLGLGWGSLAKTGDPLYRHVQQLGGRALFVLVPAGTNGKGELMVGSESFEESVCEPGTLVWTEAEIVDQGGERSFWVTTGAISMYEGVLARSRFLVDTGTPFLLVPTRVFDGLVSSVFPGETFHHACSADSAHGNVVVCDCSVAEARGMQPLKLTLGGRPFEVPVKRLFRRVKDDKGQELCVPQFQKNLVATTGGSNLEEFLDLMPGLTTVTEPPAAGGIATPTEPPASAGWWEQVKDSAWRAVGHVSGKVGQAAGDLGVRGLRSEALPLRTDGKWSRPKRDVGRRLRWEAHDPMDDFWILGGGFLQLFVTAYDFDLQRLGFCEPAQAASVPTTGLSTVPKRPLESLPLPPSESGSLQQLILLGRRLPEADQKLLLLLSSGGVLVAAALCTLGRRRCAGRRSASPGRQSGNQHQHLRIAAVEW